MKNIRKILPVEIGLCGGGVRKPGLYSPLCGLPQALQNVAEDEMTAPQKRHCICLLSTRLRVAKKANAVIAKPATDSKTIIGVFQ